MIEEIRTSDIKEIKTLYKDKYDVKEYYLKKDGHEIYYETSGNELGIPVVFVHGGPGSPFGPKAKTFFNKDKYFIVVIDQRGCGNSKPFGETKDNDTFKLVEDMEDIRKKLNISKWIVFGGSWGSTLSLVYAINHPDRVINLVLRGIFLAREKDTNWLFKEGASNFYPQEFEKYLSVLTKEERKDPIKSYSKYLNQDLDIARKYAKAWSDWEAYCVKLNYEKPSEEISDVDISKAKMENHYMINSCFIKENYILDNISKIENIKTYIVHGRYDVDCLISGAYDLYKALKNAKLFIIQDAGHSSLETGITHKLVDIMDKIDV